MKRIIFTPLLILLFLSVAQAAISQEIGMASYYADKFQGRMTASGEKYDKSKMTCAHKTYAFGTRLKVTRLDNGKSVIVRVNDRGPNVSGRVVDVSKAAAQKLGMLQDGVIKVKVEVYKPSPSSEKEKKETAPAKETSKPGPNRESSPSEYGSTSPAKSSSKPANSSTPQAVKDKKKVTTPSSSGSASTSSKPAAKPRKETPLTSSSYQEGNGFYKIQIFTTPAKGFATQIGVYSDFNNAMKEIAKLQGKGFKDIFLKMETPANAPTRYKLMLGLRNTREEADIYRKNLYKKYKIKGFVTEVK